MRAIPFEEQNMVLAKEQPDYNQLPVHFTNPKDNPKTPVHFCMELDEADIQKLIENKGRIWFSQLTFCKPFNPIQVSLEKPDFNSDGQGGKING